MTQAVQGESALPPKEQDKKIREGELRGRKFVDASTVASLEEVVRKIQGFEGATLQDLDSCMKMVRESQLPITGSLDTAMAECRKLLMASKWVPQEIVHTALQNLAGAFREKSEEFTTDLKFQKLLDAGCLASLEEVRHKLHDTERATVRDLDARMEEIRKSQFLITGKLHATMGECQKLLVSANPVSQETVRAALTNLARAIYDDVEETLQKGRRRWNCSLDQVRTVREILRKYDSTGGELREWDVLFAEAKDGQVNYTSYMKLLRDLHFDVDETSDIAYEVRRQAEDRVLTAFHDYLTLHYPDMIEAYPTLREKIHTSAEYSAFIHEFNDRNSTSCPIEFSYTNALDFQFRTAPLIEKKRLQRMHGADSTLLRQLEYSVDSSTRSKYKKLLMWDEELNSHEYVESKSYLELKGEVEAFHQEIIDFETEVIQSHQKNIDESKKTEEDEGKGKTKSPAEFPMIGNVVSALSLVATMALAKLISTGQLENFGEEASKALLMSMIAQTFGSFASPALEKISQMIGLSRSAAGVTSRFLATAVAAAVAQGSSIPQSLLSAVHSMLTTSVQALYQRQIHQAVGEYLEEGVLAQAAVEAGNLLAFAGAQQTVELASLPLDYLRPQGHAGESAAPAKAVAHVEKPEQPVEPTVKSPPEAPLHVEPPKAPPASIEEKGMLRAMWEAFNIMYSGQAGAPAQFSLPADANLVNVAQNIPVTPVYLQSQMVQAGGMAGGVPVSIF